MKKIVFTFLMIVLFSPNIKLKAQSAAINYNQLERGNKTYLKGFSLNKLLSIQNIDPDGTKYKDIDLMNFILSKLSKEGKNLNSLSKIELEKFKNTYLFDINSKKITYKISELNAKIKKRYISNYYLLPRWWGWHKLYDYWFYGDKFQIMHGWANIYIHNSHKKENNVNKRWFYFNYLGHAVLTKGWFTYGHKWMYSTGSKGYLTNEGMYVGIHKNGSGPKRFYYFDRNGYYK